MKKHIANIITLTSLCIGVISVIKSFELQFELAAYLIFTCFLLDGLDGSIARLLETATDFGKQLDSLSDMVCFGLAPGLLMYNFMYVEFNTSTISYLALLIPICSALRLSKYNIDTNQTRCFSGLTTPANAIFFGAIPLISIYDKNTFITHLLLQPSTMAILLVIMSMLLIGKFNTFNLRIDVINLTKRKMYFIFLSIMILFIFNFTGLLIIIFLYILFSILKIII